MQPQCWIEPGRWSKFSDHLCYFVSLHLWACLRNINSPVWKLIMDTLEKVFRYDFCVQIVNTNCSHLEEDSEIAVCSLVCKLWRSVLMSNRFWWTRSITRGWYLEEPNEKQGIGTCRKEYILQVSKWNLNW